MKYKRHNQKEFDEETAIVMALLAPHRMDVHVNMPAPKFTIGSKVYTALECHACKEDNLTQIVQVIITGMELHLPVESINKTCPDKPKLEWRYTFERMVYKNIVPDKLMHRTHGMGFHFGLTVEEGILGETKEEVRKLVCKAEIERMKRVKLYAKTRERALKRELEGLNNDKSNRGAKDKEAS